jgi:hypothetical protein
MKLVLRAGIVMMKWIGAETVHVRMVEIALTID